MHVNSKSLPDKEAELIIREAELKALEILEKTKSDNNRLKDEILVLKQQKNSFIKRLKHLFASQLELLDVLEIEDIDLKEISELSKQHEKRKVQNSVIQKMPAFLRQNKKIESDLNEQLDKITENKSTTTNNETDISFIKQKAKEILADDEAKNDNENKKVNLDKLLGKIGSDLHD
jgi:predicted metal-dependent hydrolase